MSISADAFVGKVVADRLNEEQSIFKWKYSVSNAKVIKLWAPFKEHEAHLTLNKQDITDYDVEIVLIEHNIEEMRNYVIDTMTVSLVEGIKDIYHRYDGE